MRTYLLHPQGGSFGPFSLEFVREKLAQGAVACTTGATVLVDGVPSGHASVGDLFPIENATAPKAPNTKS